MDHLLERLSHKPIAFLDLLTGMNALAFLIPLRCQCVQPGSDVGDEHVRIFDRIALPARLRLRAQSR